MWASGTLETFRSSRTFHNSVNRVQIPDEMSEESLEIETAKKLQENNCDTVNTGRWTTPH